MDAGARAARCGAVARVSDRVLLVHGKEESGFGSAFAHTALVVKQVEDAMWGRRDQSDAAGVVDRAHDGSIA